MEIRRTAKKKFSIPGMVGLAMIVIGAGSMPARAGSGGLTPLLAAGVPTLTATLGSPCKNVSCSNCDKWKFSAPVALTIAGATSNSTANGCIQSDANTETSNGAGFCFLSSGTMTITKPSGKVINAAMGGQLCVDTEAENLQLGSFHLGYMIIGGTGPFAGAQGTGDFNMNFIVNFMPKLTFSATALDMHGNINP